MAILMTVSYNKSVSPLYIFCGLRSGGHLLTKFRKVGGGRCAHFHLPEYALMITIIFFGGMEYEILTVM